MLSEFLKKNITSQAGFIVKNGYGYGQVEPNHLSAQRTAQVYAQLPAAADINVLEQGQFVKYDYANGVVNFTGPGEWMLVFNEIKLYRDNQLDAEFAMIKDNYQARVYSPFGGAKDGTSPDTVWTKQSRWYNGQDSDGNTSITLGRTFAKTADTAIDSSKTYYTYSVADGYVAVETADADELGNYYEMTNAGNTYNYDDVTAAPDMYEIHYNEDPFHIEGAYKEAMMPAGTTMVPRVFKTNVGDIMTTNTIADQTVAVGNKLVPDANNKGILTVKASPAATDMVWQVVKVYTMPDHQPGVKVMRIQ
jgi:hypothetical protein